MKTYRFLSFTLAFLVAAQVLASFSAAKGGDLFAIYLNGKQVHRQFVLADQRVKTLEFTASDEKDKIEVFYLHCGRLGTNRVLTLRNAKNEVVKELKFADGDNQSKMGFYSRDVVGNRNTTLQVFYASRELPNGKLLATMHWSDKSVLAKH